VVGLEFVVAAYFEEEALFSYPEALVGVHKVLDEEWDLEEIVLALTFEWQ
jgi:hypothetical protein